MASAEAKTPEWRVGDAENFQKALQRAVLAGAAMQHVEGDVGLGGSQRHGDLAGDVDRRDPIAETPERIGARFARAQRDFALSRPASHENGDMLGHWSDGCLSRSADSRRHNRIDNWRNVECFISGRAPIPQE